MSSRSIICNQPVKICATSLVPVNLHFCLIPDIREDTSLPPLPAAETRLTVDLPAHIQQFISFFFIFNFPAAKKLTGTLSWARRNPPSLSSAAVKINETFRKFNLVIVLASRPAAQSRLPPHHLFFVFYSLACASICESKWVLSGLAVKVSQQLIF